MTTDIRSSVDEALRRTHIKSAIAASTIDEAFIRSQLLRRGDDLLSEAAAEISEHDAVFKEWRNASAELSARTRSGIGTAIFWVTLVIVGLAAAMVGLSAPLAWAPARWASDAVATMSTFNPVGIGVWSGFLVVAAVILAGGYWQVFGRSRRRAAVTVALGLDEISRREQVSEMAADKALAGAISAQVFKIINESRRPFFAQKLQLARSSSGRSVRQTVGLGLSETLGQANEIPTAARADVLSLIRAMPGGNIGISGPRGVGKSTLLNSLCQSSPEGVSERTLAIYTAAPVEYDGRDFLLHLFASLCRQVLHSQGVRGEWNDDESALEAGRIWERTVLRGKLTSVSRLLLVIGGVLTAIGLALSLLITLPAAEPSTVAPPKPSAGSAPHAATDPSPPEAINPLAKNADAIGFKPGPLLLLGILALGVGLALSLSRRAGLKNPFREYGPLGASRDLVSASQKELRNIRFQRSYTTGWSGGLKIPAGVELSANVAMQLSQHPESLPELVTRYRTYVETLVARYSRVIVGIDELDKLKSSAQAETFLNELKSVFNISGCFYLISVSEHALSNFDRRGIGFRDAFDSALDHIHQVDYLDLDGSRALLFRRVINLPEPFLHLCHVLSGGLPRDLIRIARAMLDLATRSSSDSVSLIYVSDGLIRQEVTAKVRAISVLVRSSEVDPTTNALLSAMDELLTYRRPDDLPALAASLEKVFLSGPAALSPSRSKAHQEELSLYLRFLATVDALSKRLLTRAGCEAAVDDGLTEGLAGVRQGLEISTWVAATRLKAMDTRVRKRPAAQEKSPTRAPG